MSNNLPIIHQDTSLVLAKSNSLIRITNKILTSKRFLPQEVIEEWIRVLWEWADECNIPSSHFPRDKEKLLALTQLNFFNMKIESIPKEFGELTQLTSLDLWDNHITKLPYEIDSLINLKKLQLRGNPLFITSKQQLWIETLKKSGCVVYMDDVPTATSSITATKTTAPKETTANNILLTRSTVLATALLCKPFVQMGHTDRVRSVVFSPDGKTALSGSDDFTLKLWDINTGKVIRSFEGHTGGIYSVAFSPDGKTVLSGSDDKTLKLWDISTGKVIRTMIFFEYGEWITITPEGYFDHSENGRQYLNVLTSPMNVIDIDDVTYNHYYRPTTLSSRDSFESNLPEIDINEDEIPF